MLIDSKSYIQEKTNELLKGGNNKELFNDANLIYDYNEVLELFYGTKEPVFINGSTKLKKTELLHQVIKELGDQGYTSEEVFYIDCRVPFLRGLKVLETINKDKIKFIMINEVQELLDFADLIAYFYNGISEIKLVATCSVPEVLYELQYDKYPDLKIVVLSEKNDSNIKIDQVTFGVFENLKYNIKNGVCEIKGMTKEGKSKRKHIIPEMIEGYPVKIIASGAFHHRTELEEIIFPDTIEYIGDYAFTYCENLKEITLPEKLQYIGDCSFLGAKNLQTIIGGDNITHIGHSALYGTKWLNQQKNDFAILGKTLYKYLSTTKEVMIPENIITLGNYAFANSKIKKVTLSKQIFGEGVFYNCEELEEVLGIEETTIPPYTFYNNHLLKTKMNNISNVGSFAFYNCRSIEKVLFKNSIVLDNGFENCGNIKIPIGSIQTAGVASFYNSGIVNVDLRETSYIDEFAFANTKLRKQHIDRVLQVNSYAFMNVEMLEEISFSMNAVLKKGILLNSNNVTKASIGGKYPLRYYFLGKSSIEELSVLNSTCDNFARGNTVLKKIILYGENVGDWAFYNNSNLEIVEISTNSLGNWSFARCPMLKSIEIPKQINYIDMNCFRYCENLINIVIENPNLVLFGPNAFYSTGLSKNIYVHNKSQYVNNELWNEYSSSLVEIKRRKVTLDSINNAPIKLDNLVDELEVHNLSFIDQEMFEGVNRVKKLLIDGEDIVIEKFAFRNWAHLEDVKIKAKSLILDDSVFEGCINVLQYDLPDNTEIVGCRVFKNNKSLEHFRFPIKTTRVENGLFSYCENLKQVELHDRIKIISDKAFQYNTSLKYLILPKTVKEVGEKCFKGCEKIELIYIPSEIDNIAINAFIGCENLTICSEKKIKEISDKITVLYHKNIYDRFNYCLEQYFTILNKKITIEIDRPIGTLHPKRENVYYPINYGFVPGLMGGDDEEQDVYVIDSNVVKTSSEVKIIGIVIRLNDVESKWIGVEDEKLSYTINEIESIINFQEQYYEVIILK